jgi:hypothetical protein
MASNHLLTLKAMCLNADIQNKVTQREALGWALARLNELTGTKVAEALSGRQHEQHKDEVKAMQAQIDTLNELVDFICKHQRLDRQRITNQHNWRRSLDAR